MGNRLICLLAESRDETLLLNTFVKYQANSSGWLAYMLKARNQQSVVLMWRLWLAKPLASQSPQLVCFLHLGFSKLTSCCSFHLSEFEKVNASGFHTDYANKISRGN